MIVGGCKSKKEDLGALGDPNISVNENGFSNIENVLKVEPRKITDAQGEAALKAANLWQKSDNVTWESRSGGKGTYTFKNLSGTHPKGDVSFVMKTLKLTGLHKADETVTADLVEIGAIAFEAKGGELTVKNVGLRNATIPVDFSDLVDPNILFEQNDDQIFSAFVMSGVNGKIPDFDFDIKQLGWGQDPQDNHLRISADDVSINGIEKRGGELSFTLDALEMRGLNPMPADGDGETFALKLSPEGISDILGGNLQVGDFLAKDFKFSSDGFTAILPKAVQTAKIKGDVTQLNFSMPTAQLKMSEVLGMSDEDKRSFALMKSVGLDDIELSSSAQSEINKATDFWDIKGASFDLKDGFDLNYSGGFSGIDAMRRARSNPELLQADREAAVENFKIHDFALSLEDKSIVDSGFVIAGAMFGQSPEDLRRTANGALGLASLAAFTQSDGKIYTELTRSLGAFLQDGGTLNIALKPDTPISVKEFEGLSLSNRPNLKRLGLSSSVTKDESQ